MAAVIKRVHHVGVSVSEMEQSLRFYRDALGLELVFDVSVRKVPDLEAVVGMHPVRARTALLAAGEASYVELWQYEEPEGRALPDGYRAADRGVTHLALEVDDVEALYERVTWLGYEAHSVPKDLRTNTATYLRGPDREIVEILQETEKTATEMKKLASVAKKHPTR